MNIRTRGVQAGWRIAEMRRIARRKFNWQFYTVTIRPKFQKYEKPH
jgi:hypothetical protein